MNLSTTGVQSINIGRTSGSTRVITTFWILATFVFVNVYNSCIMSYMSLRFQRPVINTLQDLANNPNYLPTAFKDVAPENILMVQVTVSKQYIAISRYTCVNYTGRETRNSHEKNW